MIYLGAGDTPLRLSIHLSRGLFKFILFKYNMKCFLLGLYNQSFRRKGQRGWEDHIIMHFFIFWRSGVIFCIL